MDTSASLPIVALILSSHEGYQHAYSGTGLGAGCVPAASILQKGQQKGKILGRLVKFCRKQAKLSPR